ncbi:endo-1,4-beta-xylanase 5-like isoform X2 [Tripterygium wilfordii]|uniref:endo-1,4-beta-xylanase 5-like isoform X2 n=1 Tax=Tripterygium wilfordii TaxID=458696 RepID=UPI0018F804C8|nr:endo-1,4-beta-xylanase 5-like isoform X2 [Tripterygium wilfordii]
MLPENLSLVLSLISLYLGQTSHASTYDYSATTQCVVQPGRTHYGGGIIVNPEFNHGIEGWTTFGQGVIKEGMSEEGNRFVVAHRRTRSLDGISQKVVLEEGMLYSFSAWIQLSDGSDTVAVVFRTSHGDLIHGGKAAAKQGCWSLLKGGLVANFSGTVDILIQSKNTTGDIWIDNVSLQPFTKQQWRSHQAKSIDKVRRAKFRFKVTTNANKTVVEGAVISINHVESGFPFGCGMNYHILQSTAYQDWFALRFKFATFTNEMKWYTTEKVQGHENYTLADAMLSFAKLNGISVRGHNIFWDNPKQQPGWVKDLSPEELRIAAEKRILSVVKRYSGQLIAWDVMNENLHFHFFEDKLGENASAFYYYTAHQLDPNTTMFINEYNTIEHSKDETAHAVNYMNKLENILAFPGNKDLPIGIGLQGHFGAGEPNLAYMRSALDILGSTGYPIWLTEVDIDKCPNQAKYLEDILWEGYTHPAVKGIIIFAGPEYAGFNVTTLADRDFKNTEAGDVVDKLIREWKTENLQFKADNTGSSEISLFHGEYNVTAKHPVTDSSTSQKIKVTQNISGKTVHIHID